MPETQQPVLVLMGVSGSGKSTVAAILAGQLGWDFQEGDDLHPAANVAKMAAGHPLDDADRQPWLATIGAWIREHTDTGLPGLVTCSALKRSYRDVLRGEHVVFVYFSGTPEQLRARLATRMHEFMPASLLDSQLAALEPPGPDERSLEVPMGATATQAAADIIRTLDLHPEPGSSALGHPDPGTSSAAPRR